jgi:hypothetical protein
MPTTISERVAKMQAARALKKAKKEANLERLRQGRETAAANRAKAKLLAGH